MAAFNRAALALQRFRRTSHVSEQDASGGRGKATSHSCRQWATAAKPGGSGSSMPRLWPPSLGPWPPVAPSTLQSRGWLASIKAGFEGEISPTACSEQQGQKGARFHRSKHDGDPRGTERNAGPSARKGLGRTSDQHALSRRGPAADRPCPVLADLSVIAGSVQPSPLIFTSPAFVPSQYSSCSRTSTPGALLAAEAILKSTPAASPSRNDGVTGLWSLFASQRAIVYIGSTMAYLRPVLTGN